MDNFNLDRLINKLDLIYEHNSEKIPIIQLQILYAITINDLNLVKDKISEGANLDYVYFDKWEDPYPLIFYAVYKGNYFIIKELIDNGCNTRVRYGKDYNYCLLEVAVHGQKINICELLINSGTYISCFYRDENYVLSAAIHGNNLEILELLLKNMKPSEMSYQGSKYYILNNKYMNPLHICTQNFKPEMYELLLKYGADPNYINLGLTSIEYLEWCKKNYFDNDGKYETLINIYQKYYLNN